MPVALERGIEELPGRLRRVETARGEYAGCKRPDTAGQLDPPCGVLVDSGYLVVMLRLCSHALDCRTNMWREK